MSDSADLYRLQDEGIRVVYGALGPGMDNARLCGGTALARFYLNHRLSYDLDFFLPAFSPTAFAAELARARVPFVAKSIIESESLANQLHGFLQLGRGDEIKVSFVEDIYAGVYGAAATQLGGIALLTDPLDGLYHRKLRVVSGHHGEGDHLAGGRQAARDLFDLYVLSKAHKQLRPFIRDLPYSFPVEAFENGLLSMPWFSLIGEFQELAAAPEWKGACDVDVVRRGLLDQLDLLEELHDDNEGTSDDDINLADP